MRCAHPIMEVEQFTPFGVHTRCLRCGHTSHIDQDSVENHYLPFSFIAVPPEDDIHLYIREDVLSSWPRR